jgi:uncharacterized membrane protein
MVAKYDAAGVYLGDRPVRWEASSTAATELGGLGTDAYRDVVSGMNEADTIVGKAPKYDEAGAYYGDRAVRWDASGTNAIELAELSVTSYGRADSVTSGINNSGLVVGSATKYDASDRSSGNRAVLWTQDGTIVDLNSLIDPAGGWVLTDAYSISDTNYIAGVGVFSPGNGQAPYARAFLMQAPEPATSVPFMLAATAIFIRRRRSATR